MIVHPMKANTRLVYTPSVLKYPSHPAYRQFPIVSVEVVLGGRCGPKIGYSGVGSVAVDMVDFIRHRLSVDHEPCKAMGKIKAAIDLYLSVTVGSRCSGNSACVSHVAFFAGGLIEEMRKRPHAPMEHARVRSVIQALANILARWHFLWSHSILLPGSLVRRAVAWQASPFSAAEIARVARWENLGAEVEV